jgi:hypothetical protein
MSDKKRRCEINMLRSRLVLYSLSCVVLMALPLAANGGTAPNGH